MPALFLGSGTATSVGCISDSLAANGRIRNSLRTSRSWQAKCGSAASFIPPLSGEVKRFGNCCLSSCAAWSASGPGLQRSRTVTMCFYSFPRRYVARAEATSEPWPTSYLLVHCHSRPADHRREASERSRNLDTSWAVSSFAARNRCIASRWRGAMSSIPSSL